MKGLCLTTRTNYDGGAAIDHARVSGGRRHIHQYYCEGVIATAIATFGPMSRGQCEP